MKRILFIDDDHKISKALTEIFNSDHVEINSIFKGSEAIRTVANLGQNLIFGDLELLDMPGLELLKQIEERNSDQLMIMMIDCSSAQSVIECVKGGACEYISKSFQITERENLTNTASHKTEPE